MWEVTRGTLLRGISPEPSPGGITPEPSPEGEYKNDPGESGLLFDLALDGTKLRWKSITCGNSCYLSPTMVDISFSGRPKTDHEEVYEVGRLPDVRSGLQREAGAGGFTATARGREIQVTVGARSYSISAPATVADLAMTPVGLFYLANAPWTARPGRVVFIPREELRRALPG